MIEEALRGCISKQQMMSPNLVSLSNLPNQTTLLLPGPEFPRLQRLEDVKEQQLHAASQKTIEPVTRPQQEQRHCEPHKIEPQTIVSEGSS